MAEHIGGPCHCRSRIDQLPCRSESGYTLLPEPDFFRSRVFYNQCLHERRLVQSGVAEQHAGSRRNQILALGSFRQAFECQDGRQKENRCRQHCLISLYEKKNRQEDAVKKHLVNGSFIFLSVLFMLIRYSCIPAGSSPHIF